MKAKFIGIDISEQMLKKAGERLRVRGLDVKMKKKDHSVDIVISNMALHHLRNYEKDKATRGISRVLKDDGKAMVGDIIFFTNLTGVMRQRKIFWKRSKRFLERI
jgi:putative AdoMet-dependent methyltransferase